MRKIAVNRHPSPPTSSSLLETKDLSADDQLILEALTCVGTSDLELIYSLTKLNNVHVRIETLVANGWVQKSDDNKMYTPIPKACSKGTSQPTSVGYAKKLTMLQDALTWSLSHDQKSRAMHLAIELSQAKSEPGLVASLLKDFGYGMVCLGQGQTVLKALDYLEAARYPLNIAPVLHALLQLPYEASNSLAHHYLLSARAHRDQLDTPGRVIADALMRVVTDEPLTHFSNARFITVCESDLTSFETENPSQTAAVIVARVVLHAARGWEVIRRAQYAQAVPLLELGIRFADAMGYLWISSITLDLLAIAASRSQDWALVALATKRLEQDAAKGLGAGFALGTKSRVFRLSSDFDRGLREFTCYREEFASISGNFGSWAGTRFQIVDCLQHILCGQNTSRRVDELEVHLHRLGPVLPTLVAGYTYDYVHTMLRERGRSRAEEAARWIEWTLGRDSVEAHLGRFIVAPDSSSRKECGQRLLACLENSAGAWTDLTLVHAWLALATEAEAHRRSSASDDFVRNALECAHQRELRRPFLSNYANGQGRTSGLSLVKSRSGRFGQFESFADTILSTYSESNAIERLEQLANFTPKELVLLAELPSHLSIAEIASRQQTSPNTVKTHLRSIYNKLGVRSRADAVTHGRKFGLI